MVSLKKKSFDLPTDGPTTFENCSTDSDSDESPKFYRHRKLTAERMKSKVKVSYICINGNSNKASYIENKISLLPYLGEHLISTVSSSNLLLSVNTTCSCLIIRTTKFVCATKTNTQCFKLEFLFADFKRIFNPTRT